MARMRVYRVDVRWVYTSPATQCPPHHPMLQASAVHGAEPLPSFLLLSAFVCTGMMQPCTYVRTKWVRERERAFAWICCHVFLPSFPKNVTSHAAWPWGVSKSVINTSSSCISVLSPCFLDSLLSCPNQRGCVCVVGWWVYWGNYVSLLWSISCATAHWWFVIIFKRCVSKLHLYALRYLTCFYFVK